MAPHARERVLSLPLAAVRQLLHNINTFVDLNSAVARATGALRAIKVGHWGVVVVVALAVAGVAAVGCNNNTFVSPCFSIHRLLLFACLCFLLLFLALVCL